MLCQKLRIQEKIKSVYLLDLPLPSFTDVSRLLLTALRLLDLLLYRMVVDCVGLAGGAFRPLVIALLFGGFGFLGCVGVLDIYSASRIILG